MKMKWTPDGFKSDMARAQGLGSAHHGASHWIHQRITAFASIFLMAWLVISLKHLIIAGGGFDAATIWLQSGLNPVLMILTVIATFYHAILGMQVILEDYIPTQGTKIITITLIKLLLVAMGTLCVFAVLKISL